MTQFFPTGDYTPDWGTPAGDLFDIGFEETATPTQQFLRFLNQVFPSRSADPGMLGGQREMTQAARNAAIGLGPEMGRAYQLTQPYTGTTVGEGFEGAQSFPEYLQANLMPTMAKQQTGLQSIMNIASDPNTWRPDVSGRTSQQEITAAQQRALLDRFPGAESQFEAALNPFLRQVAPAMRGGFRSAFNPYLTSYEAQATGPPADYDPGAFFRYLQDRLGAGGVGKVFGF